MWVNPKETEDLVTFTEEILDGKLRFFCSEGIDTEKTRKILNGSWKIQVEFEAHKPFFAFLH